MDPLFPEDGSVGTSAQEPTPKRRRRAPLQEPAPEVAPEVAPEPAPDALAAARERLGRAEAARSEAGRAYLAAHAELEEARRALYAAQFPPLPDGAQPSFHELRTRSAALSKLCGSGRGRPRPRKPSPQLWRGKA